jgi:antitoxin CcdA
MISAQILQAGESPLSQPARKATRKPTNVSLPSDLLDRAKQLDVNISRASERGLREEVHEAEARAWAAQHAGFIAEMNARIEHDGLPLDEHRLFGWPVLICTTTLHPDPRRNRRTSSMCRAII